MDRTFQWGDWSEAPRVHCFDPSCGSCGFSGPLQLRYGYQVQPGQRVRRLTQRSNIAEGTRPVATTTWDRSRRLLTHIAFRCPSCREEIVYRYASDGSLNLEVVEELYRPPAPAATVTRLPVGNER